MIKMLRQTALRAANTSAFSTALRMLDKVTSANTGVLAVVTYHRVDHAQSTPDLYPGLISATPDRFEQQIDLLAEMGHVVSMQQVLEACRGRQELPAKSVLITFDDACQDFAEYAWPVLKSRQLPATMFVPTAYPDNRELRFWWDRLFVAIWRGKSNSVNTPAGRFELQSDTQRTSAVRTLRDYVKGLDHEAAVEFLDNLCEQQNVPPPPCNVMGWEQLRELSREGVTMAPHTQTHPLLTRVSFDQARKEVVGSFKDLQREIGDVLPVFAYPGGQYSQAVTNMLRNEDFELAFTVERGVNNLRAANRLALKRINVGQTTTCPIIKAQLLAGWWSN